MARCHVEQMSLQICRHSVHAFRASCCLLVPVLAVVLTGFASGADGGPGNLTYSRDIQPILARNCFACHGPDEAARQAGLRLDRREDATSDREHGPAITPGKPESGTLWQRLVTSDSDLRMPPPESGLELDAEQLELIRRWIEAGANYERHWAFEPIRRPEPPTVSDVSRVNNDIDRFIINRLERDSNTLSPPADRYALIRRVSLDLTGLPPTPEQTDAFVADTSSDAYEQLVSRLLQSPGFGEHWARMWLDLARYADTKGYEKDQPRDIWRYRDWVIEAINDDMPYDQFTIEQLAGDLLPDATMSQHLATAFHRNTMTNDEGGTDNEEFRVAAVKDRVDSTIQIWMGLTMGCGKCHSHKYDPISQHDYYSLMAVFNQTEDADRPDDAPRLATPTRDQQAQLSELTASVRDLTEAVNRVTPEFVAARTIWENELRSRSLWKPLIFTMAESQGQASLQQQPDSSVLAGGTVPEKDIYTLLTAEQPPQMVTSIRLEALAHRDLPKSGPGRNPADPNFVVSELTVTRVDSAGGRESLALANARADFSQNGWPVAGAVDGNLQTGWAVSPAFGQTHVAVFDFERPVALQAGERLEFQISQQYGNRLVLGCLRLSLSSEASESLVPTVSPVEELVRINEADRTPQQTDAINAAFRRVYEPWKPLVAQLDEARNRLDELNRQIVKTPVMKELPEQRRRETRLHIRGNFLDLGDIVQPGVPAAFGKLPSDAPGDRLAVARWLVAAENPLTARVAVNRIWSRFFGRGIVETEEDFGVQGSVPDHPELLDWLADTFRDTHQWSLKELCRTIVLSETYRQSSQIGVEPQHDPENRLLSRSPRFRLPAETVRDQALAIAGLLSAKSGGPSVMPPQPAGIWKTTYSQIQWATSPGEDRHRRGLYTFWRRTSPYPSMLTFDAGSREVCVIRRVRTNTPLQALVTLNDPVFLEAAGGLARITANSANDDRQRLQSMFRRALVRHPVDRELHALQSLLDSVRNDYRSDEAAAAALLAASGNDAADIAESPDSAAWVLVANVILNLDELLMRP